MTRRGPISTPASAIGGAWNVLTNVGGTGFATVNTFSNSTSAEAGDMHIAIYR